MFNILLNIIGTFAGNLKNCKAFTYQSLTIV